MIIITISFARNSLQNWFSSSIAITPCQALRKGDLLKICLLFHNWTISMCRSERTKLKRRIYIKKKTLIRLTFAWRNLSHKTNPWHFFPYWEGFSWVSHSVSAFSFFTWKKKPSKLLKTWPHMMIWQEGWLDFAGYRIYHRISLAISPVNRVLVGLP